MSAKPCQPAWLRMVLRAWAVPYSALGCLAGLAILLGGGQWQLRAGALEFFGGRLGRLASRLPPSSRVCAITLGHVILGVDRATLAAVRAHEQVHVRQYERWGVLFVPAYLASSAAQLLRGRRPYLDNHFEREARASDAAHARDA